MVGKYLAARQCAKLTAQIDPMGACIIALGVSISWIRTSHGAFDVVRHFIG